MLRRVAAALLASLVVLLGSIAVAAPSGAATRPYWVAKIQLSKVWKITKGAGVTVAVVDSGVPPTGSLGRRLLSGTDITSGGSGRVDKGQYTGGGGYFSHGQNMAELIAGDGSGGLQGVAPEAKILPVKVATSTATENANDTTIANGIRYAVSHGATVINLSVGGSDSCDPVEGAAVKYAYQHDVIVVASTGNTGAASVSAPADCPGALAVAGITATARPWSGSNYGSQVALANFATGITETTKSGYQAKTNGTSPATAITSGEVALLRAKYPKDSARDIVTRLLYGIDTLSSVKTGVRVNDHVGYGVPVPLDALRDDVPGNAANPIYDRWAGELGPGSGNPSSQPSSGGSGGSSSGDQPSASAPSGAASSTSSASGGGGGGISPILIVVIVVVVVAAVVIAIVVARSRRRRPPPGFGPPPGGGYGPPPQGYGPPGR